ncbi:MAG: metal-dependent transcriptional regulator [Microscillaceae bacterium]|nr:metal-dependent transcriptional regulator [Microscillaceae bacterium]
MQLSLTEEDYLKAIFYLSDYDFEKGVSTNDIAKRIDISAASVSDMIKKLSQKKMIHYVKYQGVTLTDQGKQYAIDIIRKHRLWETFLVDKLKFSWDEVHEIAEQLEHIQSRKLTERLDAFLDFPTFDPHGDPIPNEKGEIILQKRINLKSSPLYTMLKVVAVHENTPLFLKHLNKIQVSIGTHIRVLDKIAYDESLEIEIDAQRILMVSKEVAENIFVSKV